MNCQRFYDNVCKELSQIIIMWFFFYAVWSLNGEINYLMCNLAACVSIKIVTTNKPITLDLTLWLKLLSIM